MVEVENGGLKKMTGFHDYGRKGTNLLKMKYSTTFSILKVQGFCNFHPSYPSQIRFLQVVVEKTQLNVLIKWEIISTPLTKQDENEKTPPFYHIISYHIISYHIYHCTHPFDRIRIDPTSFAIAAGIQWSHLPSHLAAPMVSKRPAHVA